MEQVKRDFFGNLIWQYLYKQRKHKLQFFIKPQSCSTTIKRNGDFEVPQQTEIYI